MAYKELKGKTFKERQAECPSGYWCYKILDDDADDKNRATEVWADPHGMHCPVCKTGAVDTGSDATFMCPVCGLKFMLSLHDQDIRGRQVAIIH